MKPAPHLLRQRLAPFAQALPERPTRELRRAVLMEAACTIMAEFGVLSVSLNAYARELRMCRSTAARLFPTLQHLLAALIEDHFARIADCIAMLPEETANRPALIRAIYLRATRTENHDLTPIHRLAVRERDYLPEALLVPITALRDEIGAALGPPQTRNLIFALLDGPFTSPAAIEAVLAGGLAKAGAAHGSEAPPEPASSRPRLSLAVSAARPADRSAAQPLPAEQTSPPHNQAANRAPPDTPPLNQAPLAETPPPLRRATG